MAVAAQPIEIAVVGASIMDRLGFGAGSNFKKARYIESQK